ncbi:MAG: [FeFe] hydrogenase H-cluster radical SAM maturase HydE [Eubacterium sp.]|nr:[FeFe] hydrogenase H-cluster radical SAM maturase HydE [Eubacterium sp.]
MKDLVLKLEQNHFLTDEEFKILLEDESDDILSFLNERAAYVSKRTYGNKVYIRGLIEFTNYCRNDCYYCGIRRSNCNAERYRLTDEQILDCCETGYKLGFRTFVLQGGEDGFFSDEKIVEIIKKIKEIYPDCAVTLSIGERTYDSYKAFFAAGADRYLLRHETADSEHYSKLHPGNLSLENRMKCLYDLKEIGYQVGCGFMVGSPYQTTESIIKDLKFMKELKPHMVGIGPFIPHNLTPLKDCKQGGLKLTLRLLSIIRLMLPNVLLPATTALGTIDSEGREKGILAGANVVMPNLSPKNVRKKYLLYDNKICTGDEAAECILCMKRRMQSIGYEVVVSRGDYKEINGE